MKFKFDHFNFNVKDMDVSLKFYEEAVGLTPRKEYKPSGGAFDIVYLTDKYDSPFSLELTWMKNHPEAYDLGEQEYHLALVADNYESAYKKHKEMGCICYENTDMGIYFLEDPDGYWIEIVPPRK